MILNLHKIYGKSDDELTELQKLFHVRILLLKHFILVILQYQSERGKKILITLLNSFHDDIKLLFYESETEHVLYGFEGSIGVGRKWGGGGDHQ